MRNFQKWFRVHSKYLNNAFQQQNHLNNKQNVQKPLIRTEIENVKDPLFNT